MDHYEYTELLKTLTTKMQNVTGVVRPDEINARLSEIETLENSDGFWNDATAAGAIQKEKTQLERLPRLLQRCDNHPQKRQLNKKEQGAKNEINRRCAAPPQ